MTKNKFLDWLYFDRRHRVIYTTNAHRQKIYTARNNVECLTFGKATRTSPLKIKQVTYKPDGMPDTINFFTTFDECIQQNTKIRGKN